jgi:hypothetical protein
VKIHEAAMTYVLIIMSSFVITGFTDIKDCMEARDIVVRQFGRNLDAGAVCVSRPKDGEIIGRGSRDNNSTEAD